MTVLLMMDEGMEEGMVEEIDAGTLEVTHVGWIVDESDGVRVVFVAI